MNGGLSMVEMKSGYKMTEVGVIPEDWEVCELKNHLVLLTDYDANGSFADMASNVVTTTGNGYAWYVRATDLEQQSSLSEVKYVDEKSYRFLRKSTLYGGEVLLAKRGEIGKVYYFQMKTKRATLAPNLYLLKLKDTINSYFLFSLFKSTFGQNLLKSINASTSLGAIYKDDVKGLNILIPPFEEQASIATALSDVDSLISALTKKIEKKKAIKQGLMQQLLTGKKRLPGFCGDWIKKNVSSVSDIFRGGSPRPIENYIVKSGGVNWIKIGDVDSSAKYIFRTNEQIIESGIQYSRFVHSGDLLLSNSMSFGRPYILKTEGCIHDGWLVIQNYDKYFDKEFLYYLLGSDEVLKQYKSLAAGSSVLNLNKDIVGKVVLYFPPSISEQTAIANILSDCDSEIVALEEKRDKYKEIKQGMMQQLLTGKIRLI